MQPISTIVRCLSCGADHSIRCTAELLIDNPRPQKARMRYCARCAFDVLDGDLDHPSLVPTIDAMLQPWEQNEDSEADSVLIAWLMDEIARPAGRNTSAQQALIVERAELAVRRTCTEINQ